MHREACTGAGCVECYMTMAGGVHVRGGCSVQELIGSGLTWTMLQLQCWHCINTISIA